METLAEVGDGAVQDILKTVHGVLSYQIFTIDQYGFSLSSLLTGLALIWIGYMLSNRVSQTVDNRLLHRLNVEDSLRYTMRRFTFYVMMIFWVLFTLRLLNVPLTIFTVIGGALAVGIGFGSQNLVSNFISGVMVLLERPMRVGDQIEVGGVLGIVERIGIRATHVRTGNNATVVIPNKTFLEEFLTNWSDGGGKFRAAVKVGVAYDSDVRKVAQLALDALAKENRVLPDPAATVNFIDFGDNALVFEIVAWIRGYTTADRSAFESDLRFRLNEIFQANEISMPFPQRDVRLNMASPIQVKLDQ